MASKSHDLRYERTYYPNGQLRAEIPYDGDVISGVSRTWHDNGQLKSEAAMLKGMRHGTKRQWDRQGHLLDETEFVNGTGLVRTFFDTGQLEGELAFLCGVPHGKQTVWDESGELLVEAYYLNGRKVSKKKFEVSMSASSQRSSPELVVPTPSVETERTRPQTDVESRQRLDSYLQGLVSAPHSVEALSWLTKSDGMLGETYDNDDATILVRRLYELGARTVIAVDIDVESDEPENTGKLVVELDDDPRHRKDVLDLINSLIALTGYSHDLDEGQRYALIAID